MRNRIGKTKYALTNGAGIADFCAPEIVEMGALKTKKTNAFELAGGACNGLAACKRLSPKSSGLEQRYRAFHASLNTTNRQRSI